MPSFLHLLYPQSPGLYRILLLACLCILTGAARGQEIKRLSNQPPSFTPEDTAFIAALNNRGAVLRWKNADSAMLLFHESAQKSREVGYIDGMGLSLNNMAVIAMDQGKYERSLILFHQALPYCLQAVYLKNLPATLYNNMGNVYFAYGRYPEAAYHYYTALKALGQDTLAPLRISVCNNLGAIHVRMGQGKQALRYLEEGEKYARNRNDIKRLAFTLNNKGEAYITLNLEDKAMEQYQEGLQLARQCGDEDIQQSIEISLGELMLRQHRPEEAVRYFRHALQICDKSKDNIMIIQLHYNLGTAYYELGDYRQALGHLIPALHIAERIGLWDNITEAHASLANVYEETGDYREALIHQRIYARLRDSLFRQENTKAVNQLEIKFRTAQKDKTLAENKLLIAQQQNQLTKKNTLIWIISLSASLLTVLFLLLLTLYRNNRNKQRRQEEQIRILEQEREIKIMQALMKGGEKERTRIARELHDGIGGMLAAIQMHFSAARNRSADQTRQMENMDQIMLMLENTANEVRKTAHNLMPDILIRHSFEEALQLYCENINAGGKLQVDLQIHGTITALPKSVELSLYRIVQELMQNILKHAGATQAIIQIRQLEHMLSVMIEDNGTGFRPDQEQHGIGLQNLRSRVQALQGFLSVESSMGSGTTVYMEFALEKLKLADAI